MPVSVKTIFTVAAAIVGVAFLAFVDRGDRGPADSGLWRGGSNDSFRRLIMRPDGTLRRFTKALWAVFMVAWLCVIWLLPS